MVISSEQITSQTTENQQSELYSEYRESVQGLVIEELLKEGYKISDKESDTILKIRSIVFNLLLPELGTDTKMHDIVSEVSKNIAKEIREDERFIPTVDLDLQS
jgi:hypothetical protein